MMQFRDLKAQYQALKNEIDAGMGDVLASGQFILGKQVTELEQKLAQDVNRAYCVSCANGTDALVLSLMLWGSYFMRCHLVRLGRLQYEFGRKHYSQYDELFEGETAYVYIHIPRADNGLQPEDVDASLQLAAERLKQYFPETEGKTVVFCTQTWLLSPELREILKPTSNIVQFQNRFHIAEVTESVQPFIGFGFKKDYQPGMDFSALPEDTSLRRELKARLLRGEKLHVGFGYFTL